MAPATQAEPEPEADPDGAAGGIAEAARLLGDGHSLLARGEVVAARELFTRSLQLGSLEAALALGRAHDPRYLEQLPASDAAPDPAYAAAMYRQWYSRSVEAGAISQGVQLDRLLNALNRP